VKRLIVFDLDGTLIDSRLDLANSANEMLATYGAAPRPVDDIAGMVGEGARVLVEHALEAAGLDRHEPEAFARFLAIYSRRLLEHTRLYDGIADVVAAAAARASLAVLTNKPIVPSRRILDALGIGDRFRWVIGGDQRFARKPDPAGLLYLIHQAGASAGSTLVVGDSMIDVETARRAGVRICVVMHGFGRTRGNLRLSDHDLRAEDGRTLAGVVDDWLSEDHGQLREL
jgi:phosphoglycolate phosphatase